MDVSRNQLNGMSEDIAERLQQIQNVRLDNNPLICDECHMGKLIQIVKQVSWLMMVVWIYLLFPYIYILLLVFSRFLFFMISNQLKWSWDSYPSCFLPKSLRGSEIKYIDVNTLHTCLDSISDEEQDAASTSHNFLERGKYIIIIIPIYFIVFFFFFFYWFWWCCCISLRDCKGTKLQSNGIEPTSTCNVMVFSFRFSISICSKQ